MKSKIKNSTAAIVLVLLFSHISCYTLKDEKFYGTARVPGSTTVLDGEYYLIDNIEKPKSADSFLKLDVSKANKLKYKTRNLYLKTYTGNKTAVNWIFGSFTLASAAYFGSNPQLFGSNTTPENAMYIGVAIGCVPWLIALAANSKGKQEYYYDNEIENFEYKKTEPLITREIEITGNQLTKNFMSDGIGLVKFIPAIDFNLTSYHSNDSVEFLFKYNQKPFINSLKLAPAELMKKYVKIKATSPDIIDNVSNAVIGKARQGMFYKYLDDDGAFVKIKFGTKSGRINIQDVEIVYTNSLKLDYSAAVKNYVTEKMQEWLKQGEFEAPEDYVKRISKKEDQLFVFTNEAMQTFQKEYSENYNWQQSTISRYDPNSQTFKISIPELQEIILHVPIEKAQAFKQNWSTNVFKNQKFTLIDGEWKLVSLEIEDPLEKYVVAYDSNIANNYDPTNQFAFDLKDFEVNVPDLTVGQNKVVNQTNDELDNYSIKTDLPVTKMSQPDAIAVVIGNAYYQKTDPVNYAINDAQLMKLYLTNVLGFKEGNIIFTMNATKAEFEGLFGTDSNYKGKLFNYIKPDVSDVFVFYSGHGAPDPETKDAYFIPTDCDPGYVQLQGYALKTLYANLAKLPSKSTTIVIDACFSGSGVMKNISSVRIKPNNTEDNIRNSAILTSSTGIQVSSWYDQKKQGLFTYFFLKAIHDHKNADKNHDNELTTSEIYEYISDKTEGIPYYARRLNAVEQTPVISGSNKDRVLVKFGE